MKQAGYQIQLFFLWLPSEEVAIARVANRVKQGGHNIPEADIRRRYHSGVRNFFQHYSPTIDHWRIYNAMVTPPQLVAMSHGAEVSLRSPHLFEIIQRQGESE